jgi:hypothetical protein
MGVVTPEEFAQVATGLRWSDKNLAAARAAIVEGQPLPAIAESQGITRQQVRELKVRFLKRLQEARVVKVSADDYIAAVSTVAVFSRELRKLRRNGLADEQLLDYLKQNGVTATKADLAAVLGTPLALTKKRVRRNENLGARKPERRSR